MGNMQRYASLDVEVHLNAVTVSIAKLPSDWSLEQRLQVQATWYRTLLKACLDAKACTVFESYGLTDKYDMGLDKTIMPLPFAANYTPKPAFWAMAHELQTH